MIINFNIFEKRKYKPEYDWEFLKEELMRNHDYNQLRYIIKHSDINHKDNMDWSPLLWATYFKNITAIYWLIEAGADMYYKAKHYIGGTKNMVDFYELALQKEKYNGGYQKLIEWIEKEYPEFVAAKKYNL
jgi:ankyrin repeat protein